MAKTDETIEDFYRAFFNYPNGRIKQIEKTLLRFYTYPYDGYYQYKFEPIDYCLIK
jgi:hypothetical protein